VIRAGKDTHTYTHIQVGKKLALAPPCRIRTWLDCECGSERKKKKKGGR